MHIGDLLKERMTVRKGTWRTDMVQEFVDAINKERLGTKYKKVSFVVIFKKLQHLNDQDVSYFLSVCKDTKRRSGSFSKHFFGALKVK